MSALTIAELALWQSAGFPFTLLDVRRARSSLGWLMSSDLVDYACMSAALLLIGFSHNLVTLTALIALGVQVAGWVVSARVPK